MDEVLRRRLVGALVLVSGAWALAALLPDPAAVPGTPVASYDLRDPVQAEPAGPVPAEPVEAVSTPAEAGAEVEAEQEPEPARPPPKPPVGASAAVAPGWYVQIGSFDSNGNAKGAMQRLLDSGYPASVQFVMVGREDWYRVRVGPYADEGRARSALDQLVRGGYRGAKVARVE